jgi:hypothetical protein
VQRRTTFFEMMTEAQAPKNGCDVHGSGGGSSFVKTFRSDEAPRAIAVVNVANLQAVVMKAPTVIGNDPYNSIQAVNNVIAMKTLEGQTAPVSSAAVVAPVAKGEGAPAQPEVRRAIPTTPIPQQVLDNTIKLPPPPPLEF